MDLKEKEKINETYNEYVESITPKASLFMRMGKAFVTGGVICVLGQAILNIGKKYGLDDESAASYCSMILVFLSALLTGTGIYPKIASFGGAGALVPITGFANSVAACAHGFKVEGQVFGIGARIFQIAGPVILYGILISAALGCAYWFVGTI
ncbi:MAG: SpoVA/SpoVAEb family sporulation membrane protein [Lachnospiraceae bacterium]|nr:SpoVA/SpoVAEb family sporulation membrane protein [Lachnospiraceae bacterium]MDD6191613.1 SpoVA/SpoVAEb family sporulation membrane protein [Lachnospiraceae bacterium]MDY4793330.1 SpoVA/SpoVAEb family sporulation membrane protein [Pararoseburia sp.]